MKKSVLILLTFVPFAVGYAINRSLILPVIGSILFFALPLLTTVFWFYLGSRYARSAWKTVPALLIGNGTGIASLLVYLWQFLLKTDASRNLTLAVIPQMFSNSAPTYLLARAAILFESQPNYVGRAAMFALNVLSILYMITVFSLGFVLGKKKPQL